MDEIYSSLRSLIFQYNKDKYAKRIVDSLFDEAISQLEQLCKVNINDLSKNITIGIMKKGTSDYFALKQEKESIEDYILRLIGWIQNIISTREFNRNG